VRRDAELVEHLRDAHRAEQVDLDGGVEGRVERHRGRGVDDDVAGGEQRPAFGVEAEAVGGDVARDGGDPGGDLCGEVVGLASETVEGVVLQDLAGNALLRAAPARPHQQHQLAVGYLAQEPLDQRGAEEAGGAGDADALAGQLLADHAGWARRRGRSDHARCCSTDPCLPNGREAVYDR
jgi:hypothetical protein